MDRLPSLPDSQVGGTVKALIERTSLCGGPGPALPGSLPLRSPRARSRHPISPVDLWSAVQSRLVADDEFVALVDQVGWGSHFSLEFHGSSMMRAVLSNATTALDREATTSAMWRSSYGACGTCGRQPRVFFARRICLCAGARSTTQTGGIVDSTWRKKKTRGLRGLNLVSSEIVALFFWTRQREDAGPPNPCYVEACRLCTSRLPGASVQESVDWNVMHGCPPGIEEPRALC